jgi:hypothetical protein
MIHSRLVDLLADDQIDFTIDLFASGHRKQFLNFRLKLNVRQDLLDNLTTQFVILFLQNHFDTFANVTSLKRQKRNIVIDHVSTDHFAVLQSAIFLKCFRVDQIFEITEQNLGAQFAACQVTLHMIHNHISTRIAVIQTRREVFSLFQK